MKNPFFMVLLSCALVYEVNAHYSHEFSDYVQHNSVSKELNTINHLTR